MRTIPARKLQIAFMAMALGMIALFGYLYLRGRAPAPVRAAAVAVKAVARTPPRFLNNLEMSAEDPLRAPLGVAVAPDGRIYVADSGKDRIVVFDAEGNVVKTWGKGGTGDGEFRTPTSLAVGPGKLYVADMKNGAVKIFDLEGNYLGRLQADRPYIPLAVAVGPDGSVYVSESAAQSILVFDPQGKFERRFGGAGDAEGKLSYANGLFVDAQNRIYVADSNNARIQVFDREGRVLRTIGKPPSDDASAQSAQNVASTGEAPSAPPEDPRGALVLPRGIAVDPLGRITVVDTLAHRVNVYGQDGEFLFGFGQRGVGNGELLYPNGLAIDASSRLYITDRENARVVTFGY